jgi:AraC family transcriptional regulator of adaptative response / DNA-3-methyladenine glycosylase II
MLAFLAPRATPGLEVVEDGVYRRVSEAGLIEIRADTRRAKLVVRGGPPDSDDIVRRMFDLDADPHAISAHLGRSRPLARLVAAAPGLRLPGAWDPFELAVRAVLGQQVTVRAATTLAGRLVRTFGRAVDTGDVRLSHLFPRPEALADADVVKVGMPRARAATVRALAAAVVRGEPVLETGGGLDDAVARLCALPGIGPWTAHYIAMRGLGERDAFPASDLGLRRALGGESPREIARLAEPWRPWRAYALMYLWKGETDDDHRRGRDGITDRENRARRA